MFGFRPNPAAAYAKVGLETGVASADPHRLVLMLYDGALLTISRAEQALAGAATVWGGWRWHGAQDTRSAGGRRLPTPRLKRPIGRWGLSILRQQLSNR